MVADAGEERDFFVISNAVSEVSSVWRFGELIAGSFGFKTRGEELRRGR